MYLNGQVTGSVINFDSTNCSFGNGIDTYTKDFFIKYDSAWKIRWTKFTNASFIPSTSYYLTSPFYNYNSLTVDKDKNLYTAESFSDSLWTLDSINVINPNYHYPTSLIAKNDNSGIIINTNRGYRICMSSPIKFNATSTYNQPFTPHYQWYLNSIPVGTDSIGFTLSIVHYGDRVWCVLLDTTASRIIGISNKIVMFVDTSLPNAGFISGDSVLCMTGFEWPINYASSGGIWSLANSNAYISALGSSGCTIGGQHLGLDTLSYSVTNSCGTSVANLIFAVDSSMKPIIGLSSLCLGDSILLIDSFAGGTWYSYNTGIATVTESGWVHGIHSGFVNLQYTLSNSCISNKMIIVNPLPTDVGLSCPHDTVCLGEIILITDSATIGTGVWSILNSNAILTGDSITGVMPGIDTILFTATNSCGVHVSEKAITILAPPTVATIIADSELCVGSAYPLSDSVSGGLWTSSNASIVNTIGTNAVGIGVGNATITYNKTNYCGNATATKSVTVDGAPNAGSIIGDSVICTGATLTFTDTVTGGIWSSNDSAIAMLSAGIVTGFSAGNMVVTYSVASRCATSVATHAVTINPLANAGVIIGNDSLCLLGTMTLTDPAVGGRWKSIDTAKAVIDSVTGLITALHIGIDTVVYTVTNECNTATVQEAIYVMPLPRVSRIHVSADTICAGSFIIPTDSVSGGHWTTTGSSLLVTADTVLGISGGSGIITYRYTNYCGTAIATINIAVDTQMSPIVTGFSQLCTGSGLHSKDTLNGSPLGGRWISNDTASVTISALGVATGLVNGLSVISYTTMNSCGSFTTTFNIVVSSVPVVSAIIGPNAVCIGSTITLTDTSLSGTTSWLAENGNASINSSGVVTGIQRGATIITYLDSNICGMVSSNKTIAIDSTPFAGVISGPAVVCVGGTITMSDTVTGGIWLVQDTDLTISSGIATGVAPGSDKIYYVSANTCGTDTASVAITVMALPNPVITRTDSVLCVPPTFASYINGSKTEILLPGLYMPVMS